MTDDEKRRIAAPAAFYAALAATLRSVAAEHGYALAVHGSMATDLDLVAVPWTADASDPEAIAHAIADAVGCPPGKPSAKPHGRLAWNIVLNSPAYWSIEKTAVEHSLDSTWIDLSVMPRRQDR